MGGVPCYQVKVVWKSGREATECYAVESGLLAGRQSRVETPQGAIDQTVLIGDYKDFGGLKSATRLRQQMLGQEQIMTLDKVEFDGAADAVRRHALRLTQNRSGTKS